MDKKTYSALEIATAWDEYKTAHVWRALRGGKWTVYFDRPETGEGTTRVEMVKASQAYTFPEYLEVING